MTTNWNLLHWNTTKIKTVPTMEPPPQQQQQHHSCKPQRHTGFTPRTTKLEFLLYVTARIKTAKVLTFGTRWGPDIANVMGNRHCQCIGLGNIYTGHNTPVLATKHSGV